MAEVVWHLVDEERFTLAISTRAGYVEVAEPAEVFRRKAGKHGWIARILEIRPWPPHLEDDALEVIEFVRTLDPRMGGEDLLEKCRSGKGQPENALQGCQRLGYRVQASLVGGN